MEDRIEELYKLVTSFCEKWNLSSEDIVQELVWRIYQRLDKFDETKGKFSTFVFMNCKHYYLMYKYKDHNVESLDENSYVLDTVADNNADWYISYLYKEVCSPMLRDYLKGFKQKDIAKKYGLVYCTCNQIINRELTKLKETYGE